MNININPRWSKKHMDFLIKHKECYGLNISQEEYKEELDMIKHNKPSRRCQVNQKCFEIYDNNLYVRDILLDYNN